MPNQAAKPNHAVAMSESVDPAVVATIVRTVLDRLKAQSAESKATAQSETTHKGETTDRSIMSPDRVISVATIEKIATRSATRILIGDGAVVTPAARDEARRRGLSIQRVANPSATAHQSHAVTSSTTNPSLIDPKDRGREAAVLQQLQRRGVAIAPSIKIILSEIPAIEVQRQCQAGRRAVMIRRIDDVGRFQAELGPDVWVLDMIELNLVSAVNVAARIAKLGGIAQ